MIKKLLLLPLVLVLGSCTNDLDVMQNGKLLETHYNVHYDFDFDKECYVVKYGEDKTTDVEIDNTYTIYVSEYELIDKEKDKYYDNNQILDKLLVYTKTSKLYIYTLLR